jgi:hypothetical protein
MPRFVDPKDMPCKHLYTDTVKYEFRNFLWVGPEYLAATWEMCRACNEIHRVPFINPE